MVEPDSVPVGILCRADIKGGVEEAEPKLLKKVAGRRDRIGALKIEADQKIEQALVDAEAMILGAKKISSL